MKLSEPAVVKFLEAVWRDLPPEELLYPSSPGVYRRRWDRILKILGVPLTLGLTPASLRAGGAVAAFRKGVAVNDLLWRMRLQSLATLEYYLQEMAAVSILPELEPKVRKVVRSGAVLYKAFLDA